MLLFFRPEVNQHNKHFRLSKGRVLVIKEQKQLISHVLTDGMRDVTTVNFIFWMLPVMFTNPSSLI